MLDDMTICPNCGASLRLSHGPGRLRRYRGGEGYEIPESLTFPECPSCGAEWLTPEQIDEMGAAFEVERERRRNASSAAKHQIVALLEWPGAQAFGMVPCVEQTAEGSLVVHGLEDRLRGPLLPSDLEQLVRERRALSVDATVIGTITKATVAGWVGCDFLREAGAVPRGIPWEMRHAAGDRGHFWLGDREAIRRAMEDWMKEAARGVFVHGDEDLAKLLHWVSPDGLVTRAAVWSTRNTEEERQVLLARWAQSERDAGRPTTEAELTERLRRIRNEALRSIRLADYSSALVPRRSRSEAPLFRKAA